MSEAMPEGIDGAMEGPMVDDDSGPSGETVTMIAKFGKLRITLKNLDVNTTIAQVKDLIHLETRILPKRQKLVGLSAKSGGTKGIHDALPISELVTKGGKSDSSIAEEEIIHQFILMGTPEEQIFVDPCERDDLPDIVDDFELDFNAGSPEWIQHRANGENLKKFTEHTPIHIMNAPRENKPLLVVDLDHTLLDFSSKSLQQDTTTRIPGQGRAAAMKRPFMDDFLTKCYLYFDIVVWSQTSWRWLETKLIELGMLTHAGYKFCFVLDKTSMFTVVSTKRDGTSIRHHVKPLQIIWSKFSDRWGSHNTVHIDDLSRNFALNLDNGLQCTAFYRKKKPGDNELLGLGHYLVELVQSGLPFHTVDFSQWTDVVGGKKTLASKKPSGSKGSS